LVGLALGEVNVLSNTSHLMSDSIVHLAHSALVRLDVCCDKHCGEVNGSTHVFTWSQDVDKVWPSVW